MKARKLYVDNFIKMLEKETGEGMYLNDENGLYENKTLGIVIKSWNYEIKIKNIQTLTPKKLEKLIKVLVKADYFIEYDDGENNE